MWSSPLAFGSLGAERSENKGPERSENKSEDSFKGPLLALSFGAFGTDQNFLGHLVNLKPRQWITLSLMLMIVRICI